MSRNRNSTTTRLCQGRWVPQTTEGMEGPSQVPPKFWENCLEVRTLALTPAPGWQQSPQWRAVWSCPTLALAPQRKEKERETRASSDQG